MENLNGEVKCEKDEVIFLSRLSCLFDQLLSLFLGEAIILSLFGAGIGIAITGVIVGLVSILVPEFPVQLQASTFFIAAGVAIVTGLLSGIWPAWKSSRLSPIEALRSE